MLFLKKKEEEDKKNTFLPQEDNLLLSTISKILYSEENVQGQIPR